MRYCFVGINPGAMARYPAGIAKELSSQDSDASFTFVVDNTEGLQDVEFPLKSAFRPRGRPAAKAIRRIIEEEQPDAVITTAQRIPDSAFVSAAREAGIFTAMFQHGLYLPFMRRTPSLFLRKARKTLHYVRYAAAIGELHGRSRLRYVTALANVFLGGAAHVSAGVDHRKLNVDLVLLNGEYWRDFHMRRYGYAHEQHFVVGYPDLVQVEAVRREECEDGVCYVAQTLVEHGRLPLKIFRDFLKVMRAAVRGRDLVIKLHPASDPKIYEPLWGAENVQFEKSRLPRRSHYIGHYSTYLALVPHLSENLFLWQFPGHPIPDVLRATGADIGKSAASLRRFLERQGSAEPSPEHIRSWQHYFYYDPSRPPFQAAAEEIVQRLRARR